MGKYKNLHSKNIFDFTDDAELLEEIIGEYDRETYEHLLKTRGKVWTNAVDLWNLGEMTDNKELMKEVELQFKEELGEYEKMFNE